MRNKRQALQQRFKKLVQKRLYHEQIIQQLINYPQGSHQPSTRSNISHESNLSKQVNLLSCLNRQEVCSETRQAQFSSELIYSLSMVHGEKEIKVGVWEDVVFGGDIEDFSAIVGYIRGEEGEGLWEELFEIRNHSIHAKLFSRKEIGFEDLCLTEKPLQPHQHELILEDEENIYIGYLLLHRLLNLLGTSNYPQVLQSLFSFPYKCFNIHETNSYLQLKGLLIGKKPFKSVLYGKDMIGRLKRIDPLEVDPQLYHTIILIYEQELCYEKLPLMHQRNHYVVVDVCIEESGYYCFSCCGEEECQYKVAIMQQDKIIKSTVQQNCECFFLKLQRGEYQLYMSSNSHEGLIRFTCVVQSQHQLSSKILELKFNPDYNIFTKTLMNAYLLTADFYALERHLQSSFLHAGQDKDVVIVRCYFRKLWAMCVDFVMVKRNSFPCEIKITYQGEEILCDVDYNKNYKTIRAESEGEVNKIPLNKDRMILSCGGNPFLFSKYIL